MNADKIINRKKRIDSIVDRRQIQILIKSLVKDVTFYKTSLYKTIIYVLYHGGKTETIIYNSVARKGNKYKLFNSKCISYEKGINKFYLLKKEFHPMFNTNNLIQEFSKLKLKYNMFEPPNKTNSNVFDFDSLIKLSDIPNIVTTKNYTKITYFKDLNTKRFNRKKISKKKSNKSS